MTCNMTDRLLTLSPRQNPARKFLQGLARGLQIAPLCVGILLFSLGRSEASQATGGVQASSVVKAQAQEAYGKLPLSFEANHGQTDRKVQFLSRGSGYTFFLAPTEAVLALRHRETKWQLASQEDRKISLATATRERARVRGLKSEQPEENKTTVVRMQFAGANPTPRVTGLEALPGKANYFIGKDPAKWQTNVPTYAKVRYDDLYPGIDLVYHGTDGQLEYDFVIRPGAAPSRIALGFRGADRLEVDPQGDLVLHTAAGPIRQRKLSTAFHKSANAFPSD